MRRVESALLVAGLALAGCAMLPATQPERAMFRDARLSPDAAAAMVVPGRSTKAQVAAQLGDADRVPFDSGYEVWVYRQRPTRAGDPELVVLFAPDGLVKKVRVRPRDAAGARSP
jgi:outer membrane protein assembly factor BamE (lipoprotein component of BamABCDE complex)